jgi:hypothetical protein
MPINSLNFPTYNVNSTVDPSMWASLGNLGNVYKDAQAAQAKQRALASLGTDPQANMQTLLTSGDPGLAQIGLNLQQRGIEQQREDTRYGVTDARANAELALRQEQARREQETFEEDSPEGRTKKAVAAKMDLNAPETRAWIAAGGALRPHAPTFGETIEARKSAAAALGLDPNSDAYKAYVLTEKTPEEGTTIEKIKDPTTGQDRLVRVPKQGPAGPIDVPPPPGSTGVDRTTLTGEDYLNTLPPKRAAIVRGILDLSIDPNKLSLVGGHREGLLADAKQADSTFDAAFAPAKFAATKEFIAGGPNSPASTIVAGGTTIGHLLHASNVSQKLGGPAGYGPATGYINEARTKLMERSNDPDLKEYNGILGRIAEEGTKFYRGVGGTESDINRDIANMTPAQAQVARDRALATQASAMYSKVQALQDRWRNSMGPKAWDRVSKEQEFPVISRANIAAVNTILERGGMPKLPVPDNLKTPTSGLGDAADKVLEDARLAIAQKVPRAAVIERLKQQGISESAL